MIDTFDRIKKEWSAIRGARYSFFVVCLLIGGLMWAGFHFYYDDKLSTAKNNADNWKNSADYWKDQASHKPECPAQKECPVEQPKNPQAVSPSGGKQSKAKKTPPTIEQPGNNNGAVGGDIKQGPCSSLQVGGSQNQATVNCGDPPVPDRTIPDDKRPQIISFLSLAPAKVNLSAYQGSREAFKFANAWLAIFKEAKWEIQDNMVHTFISSGEPQVGTIIAIRGEPVAPGGTVTVPNSTAASFVARAIQTAGETLHVQTNSNQDANLVFVSVYPNH